LESHAAGYTQRIPNIGLPVNLIIDSGVQTAIGQEMDFSEERAGNVFGYEIKWKKSSAKRPKDWRTAYPESEYNVINNENFLEFLL
jgi:hypothetical protein